MSEVRPPPRAAGACPRAAAEHANITPSRAARSQASLAPAVVASLTRQLRALHSSPPEGVRFLASESGTLTELHAEIVGPGALQRACQGEGAHPTRACPRHVPPPRLAPTAVQTPYEGGVFRLKLVLGAGYPGAPPRGAFGPGAVPSAGPARVGMTAAPPRRCVAAPCRRAGFFITKIFHPNVALAGDICVNTLKRDWKADTTLSHVLQVIRCLLIVPFPESSLNDEAGKLFMESYDEYARKARLWTHIHAAPPPAAAVSAASAAAGPGRAASAAAGVAAVATSGGDGATVDATAERIAGGAEGAVSAAAAAAAAAGEPLRSSSSNALAAPGQPDKRKPQAGAPDRAAGAEQKKKLAKRL